MSKFVTVALLAIMVGTASMAAAGPKPGQGKPAVEKSDKQWQNELDPDQYRVLRCSATEAPFTGKYYHNHEDGTYLCAGCGAPLFSSAAKYDSGSGWPSYFSPINDAAVAEKVDMSLGTPRTEILCAKCGGHLGHVFRDGPRPTGLRYCVNSAALDFHPATGNDQDKPKK